MTARAMTVGCVVAAGLALGNAADGSDRARPTIGKPAWTEVAWPFPTDAWPKGRAFRCPASACGTEVAFYVRPKVGFCNCATGVADDDEIDRVGDLVLLGETYAPAADGYRIRVGDMAGRARAFTVGTTAYVRAHAIGVAFAKKCDAMSAMIVSRTPISEAAERAAFELVSGQPLLGWVEASIGS